MCVFKWFKTKLVNFKNQKQGRAEGWFLAALLHPPLAPQVLNLLLAPQDTWSANFLARQTHENFLSPIGKTLSGKVRT